MATTDKATLKQTFEEKELEILRKAIDETEELNQQKIAQSPEIKKIIKIVEEFIRNKRLICYGGTAINNILPTQDQFYNKDLELPDYDFYSKGKGRPRTTPNPDEYNREGDM